MKALAWTGDEAKVVFSRPVPHLRNDYLLIRTVSVALNPTDSKAIEQKRAAKDGLLGCDFAGVVIEVGKGVIKSWTVGDRVFGCTHGGNSNNAEDGSFAEIITAKGDSCMRIPSHVSFDQAATIAVSALTCGQGLFQEMKLRLPSSDGGSEVLNESILIYGGSSSAGMLAIQYCKLAGYSVITTCSPNNASLCKTLGADMVFDYHHANCGHQISEYTHGKLKLCWDTIGSPSGVDICMQALSTEEGAKYGTILFNRIPREDVEYTSSFLMTFLGDSFDKFGKHMAAQPEHFDFAKMFTSLTERLLKAGRLRPNPVRLCPGGLEGIVDGAKLIAHGKVRGCKLVYRIGETG